MTRSSWLIGLLLILSPLGAAWADCFSYDNGEPRPLHDPDPSIACGGPGVLTAGTFLRGVPGSLTTTYNSNNGQSGNSFDLNPLVDMTIDSFDINIDAGARDVSVYWRNGTADGAEQNATDWTLLGSASITGNGLNVPTPLAIGGLMLTAGNTYGIIIINTNGTALNYTNGGPLTFTNADLSLTTYRGVTNPVFSGATFTFRQWNGTVYYTAGGNADVSLTLTDSPDPVNAGTSLTYVATATNNGPGDAQDVSISLPLPAVTAFVSATPSAGGSCTTPAVGATGTVDCTWAGVTANATARTATVVVDVPPSATGNLSATGTVTTTSTDPDPINDSATADTAIAVSADLSITLTDAPDPVTAGTNLVYTATVTNGGPSDATGVTVTMPVPANTTFVSGSTTGGGSCAGSPIVCSFPTSFAATTSQTATITVAVSASAPNGSSISATATAGSASPDPNGANNSASTTTAVVAEANLQLTLSASSLEVLTNEPVTFTAVSLNLGPSDAQNLSITMTLTPDFRYSAHTATGATCTTPQVGTTGAITCTWAGATAVNASRTLQVVAFSNNEGATAVNASTVSDTSDPVTANNVGNVSVQVGFAVEGIPTLNQYGLILLGLMLGLLGFVAVRRNS